MVFESLNQLLTALASCPMLATRHLRGEPVHRRPQHRALRVSSPVGRLEEASGPEHLAAVGTLPDHVLAIRCQDAGAGRVMATYPTM